MRCNFPTLIVLAGLSTDGMDIDAVGDRARVSLSPSDLEESLPERGKQISWNEYSQSDCVFAAVANSANLLHL